MNLYKAQTKDIWEYDKKENVHPEKLGVIKCFFHKYCTTWVSNITQKWVKTVLIKNTSFAQSLPRILMQNRKKKILIKRLALAILSFL